MTAPYAQNMDDSLILAAEECPRDRFDAIHNFAPHDDLVIQKLIAHGPVLIRGGRGSGKSALMLEAQRRSKHLGGVFCVYISLRYLPLLQSEGDQYIGHFCELLSDKINQELDESGLNEDFGRAHDQVSLQTFLTDLALKIKRRIVLLFDDAAHIGREKPLEVFFDLFRTLSTNSTSCKASIYPGVTKFGIRFDVFNDATVVDINRLDVLSSENEFFLNVLKARDPWLADSSKYSDRLSPIEFSRFLGRAVVGNMRGFVLACSKFKNNERIGIPQVGSCMLALAQDYYWPLMDEVAPKLGVYEVFVEPAREVMEAIIELGCRASKASNGTIAAQDRLLVHRQIVSKYTKVFEILEYLGFISRREASRAMKSGGRGPVYAINLCNLLDQMPQQRLTQEILKHWNENQGDLSEMHTSGSALINIILPPTPPEHGLAIFEKPISVLAQSPSYPYGLTEDKMNRLEGANLTTVGQLARTTDAELLKLDGVGEATVKRIRNVVFQAIWM